MFHILKSPKNKQHQLVVEVRGLDVAIVNSLRRVILAEIPNVAPNYNPYSSEDNDIIVHKNTTSLHNEFMGHRVSLVPIHLRNDEIEWYDPKKYTFVLHKKNTGHEALLVTSKDIRVQDADGKEVPESERDRLFPADPITGDHILLTKLKPNVASKDHGQELHMEWRARKDIAKTHARWGVVSHCSYIFKLDDALVKETHDRLYKEKFGEEAKPDAKELKEFENRFEHIDKLRCYERNVYDEPQAFILTIESVCALKPETIFEKAIQVLRQKIADATFEIVPHDQSPTDTSMAIIRVPGQNHTLGNLLQVHIYNTAVRVAVKDKTCEYVGYIMPHPLQEEIHLKIKESDRTKKRALDIVKDAQASLLEHMDRILKEWHDLSGV